MSRHAPSAWIGGLAVAALAALAAGAGPAAASPALDWHHLHDGGSRSTDTGLAALTDPAGNPVIAGETSDAANNGNLLVRKLSRDTGLPLWTRSLEGTPENRLALGGMVWDHHGHLLIGGTRLGCFG